MSKNVIITGASSGIGRATAALLSAHDYKLVLISRSQDKLDELVSELAVELHTFKADVREYDEVKRAIDGAHEIFGTIDVVINNAGLGFFDEIKDGKIEHWHETVDTNIKGVLNVIHAALPHLLQSKGHIVNIGSVAGHHVFPNSGVYCASKWAVRAISESLRLELSDKINTTLISPGSVDTAFVDRTSSRKLLDQYKPQFKKGMSPDVVADHIKMAIESPPDSNISEISFRPTRN
jgi:NADP-dependent 3-hydroxy acid dehydrogenase YdfG